MRSIPALTDGIWLVSSAALVRHFGGVHLDRITSADVEQFKADRSSDKGQRTKRRIKPATVNRELACLKALFNHAIKADLPVRNPVSRVDFLPEHNGIRLSNPPYYDASFRGGLEV